MGATGFPNKACTKTPGQKKLHAETVANAINHLDVVLNNPTIKPHPEYSHKTKTTSGSVPVQIVSKADFITRAKSLINAPEKLDQGGTDMCGYVAVLYGFIRAQPLSFAKMATDLMSYKKGMFGNQIIRTHRPAKDIRKAVLLRDQHIFDWILLHAFLNSFDDSSLVYLNEKQLGNVTPSWLSRGLSSAFWPTEMFAEMKSIGFRKVIPKKRGKTTEYLEHLTNGIGKNSRDTVVMALIDADSIRGLYNNWIKGQSTQPLQLGNDVAHVPNHWIVITESLTRTKNMGASDTLTATIATWGKIFQVVGTDTKVDELLLDVHRYER